MAIQWLVAIANRAALSDFGAIADLVRVARRALRASGGATAIEYGLIAAGIAVAIIGVVFTLGNEISGIFETIETQINSRPR